jgi:hypothetical protein
MAEVEDQLLPGLYLIKCGFGAQDLTYDQLQHELLGALSHGQLFG